MLFRSFRHDGEGRVPLNRTFAFRGVSEVLIVVASRVTAGNFQLTLRRADDAPILSAGDWNAVNSRHLTRDPAVFGVSWQSPDVAFDTSTNPVTLPGVGEITPPGSIYFLVRNRGVVRADGLQVSARRRLLAGNSWETLHCISLPGRLETDDECRRLDTEVPLTDQQTELPAPCRFEDDVFSLPTVENTNRPSHFLWRGGAPADYLVEFTAHAPGDPNGPLKIRTTFGGRPLGLSPARSPAPTTKPT